MNRRSILAAGGAALALPAIRTARAQAAATMRLSHQYPPSHHIAQVLAGFAEDVKARSNGAVEVQLFPRSSWPRPAENFPGVARGAFEAAVAANFHGATPSPR